MAISAEIVISAFFMAILTAEAHIATPPSPVTVEFGHNVTLTCTSDGTGSTATQWQSPNGVVIWDSDGDVFSNPSKYERIGTGLDYSIRVKDAEWEDAGPYECHETGVNGETHVAEVVVVKQPQVQGDLIIDENQEAVISCLVEYAGQTMANLDASHLVQLQSFIGETKQDPDAEDIRVENGYCSSQSCDLSPSTLTQVITYQGNSADNGDSFYCRASTESPLLSLESNLTVTVRYPTRNIEISPDKATYTVGEHISCTGDGEPGPDITWTPLNGTVELVVDGDQLEMSSDMLGDNTWQCSAANELNGMPVTEQVSFAVVQGTGGGRCFTASWLSFAIATVLGLLVRQWHWWVEEA